MNVRYSAFGGGGSVATGGVSPTRGSGASSLSGFGERRDHARRGVGERVHEDVHRTLSGPDLDLEGLSSAGVVDGDGDQVRARVPQHADIKAVDGAMVQLTSGHGSHGCSAAEFAPGG